MFGRLILLLSLFLLALYQAPAIVIRHDRDDARYRELGAKYTSVKHEALWRFEQTSYSAAVP